MKRIAGISVFLFFFALLAFSPQRTRAEGGGLPAGFTRQEIGAGLTQPTAIAFFGSKFMVIERAGAIRVIRKNGKLNPQPLGALSVNTDNAERGLLGLALHPDYPNTNFIYVYYTTGPNAKNYNGTPENRVSRLRKRKDKPGFKEKILLDNIPSTNGNHNGGDIHFGFDGKLYISVGDSGCCKDDAQGLNTLRGKILRINPDGSIPTDNPFYNTPNARQETYAYGFRNPWRTTKRASNQTFIVTDVGAGTWEEINSLEEGGNYGWPNFEGPCPADNLDCNPNSVNYNGTIKPIHWYNHDTGDETGNVIAGGVFAEQSNYPAPYADAYFYGDTGAGWVHVLTMDENNQVTNRYDFDESINSPVAFGNGPDGRIYVVSHYGGVIYRYTYNEP